MDNFHQIRFLNDQQVSVFNDYKFFNKYEDFKINQKDSFINNIYAYDYAYLKRDSYFINFFMPLESDIKKLAKFEKVDYEEMNTIIQNQGSLIHKNHEYESTILAMGKNINEIKSYNLFDTSGLYTELAKIEPFNLKDIIRFSKTFGLPAGMFESIVTLPGLPITLQTVNFMELNLKLMEYRLIFEAFQNFVTKDIENIRDRLIKKEEAFLKYSIKTKNSDSHKRSSKARIENYKNAKRDYLLEWEGSNLSSLTINKHIESPSDEHLRYHDGHFILERNFFSLFEFAYFQIVQALNNRATLKTCEFCNHVFEETNEKMRFCPALPFRKRSSCEMAYNNRKRN